MKIIQLKVLQQKKQKQKNNNSTPSGFKSLTAVCLKMNTEEQTYLSIGQMLKDAEQSQMFGKPCFKINGKAFICFFQDEMVFKLTDKAHKEALVLEGSKLFDPSGKGRAMKEWVQVSFTHKAKWAKFAKEALAYVAENNQ